MRLVIFLKISAPSAFSQVPLIAVFSETGIDLAIVLALLSSYKNRALDSKTIAFGEVGLIGEVRSVSMLSQRIKEAEKLGYEVCIVPRAKSARMEEKYRKIKLIEIGNIRELASLV